VAQLLSVARALKPTRLITVIGFQADAVSSELGETGGTYVLQKDQRGTGHAVLQAMSAVGRRSRAPLLILNGDLPTLKPATLRKLIARHRRSGAALTLLTTVLDDASGYGRIVRDSKGNFQRIVEHADASPGETAIKEINAGIYCASPAKLFDALKRVRPDNAQGEYYITDAVEELVGRGETVSAVVHGASEELLGVNTRQELAQASRTLFARKATELQDKGVTLMDAGRIWIDPRARIGRDTIIYPDVQIEGPCVIGAECIIRSGSRITDCTLGRGVEIKDHSVLEQSRLGDRVLLGPFARLRPNAVLEADSRVGNFVELKNSRLGRGSKANHLSYLGDSQIETGCNIGAGTITCNYDGKAKHQTTLGKGVFIGSDVQLVAPVAVGNGAYVAAGTTVTEEVPEGALAIGRTRQKNLLGWVARQNKKKKPKPTPEKK
jgi:bifunctional UDP-N-acetylglucosamine pyrophosphorylase/glucosamine-1-phosphate N-acetyltransferase